MNAGDRSHWYPVNMLQNIAWPGSVLDDGMSLGIWKVTAFTRSWKENDFPGYGMRSSFLLFHFVGLEGFRCVVVKQGSTVPSSLGQIGNDTWMPLSPHSAQLGFEHFFFCT
jgi:hypothetical protein